MTSIRFWQAFVLFIIISTALMYFNCGDTSVVEPPGDFSVTGRISAWTLGSGKTLIAYVRTPAGTSSISYSTVETDGSFSMKFPATLSESALFSVDSFFYSGCPLGTITINNSDARCSELITFKVQEGDSVYGFVSKKNYDTVYEGAFSIGYLWTTKDFTASGRTICNSDSVVLDCSVHTGWNFFVRNYTRVTSDGKTILFNTSEPSGAEWKFTPNLYR